MVIAHALTAKIMTFARGHVEVVASVAATAAASIST